MTKLNTYARVNVENNGTAQGNQTLLKEMTDKYGYTQYGSGFKQ